MRILLSGGGTMGSVSPLIATYQAIIKKSPQTEFLFIGTKSGPEKEAVESYKIKFLAITCGKLRRYFDWQNLIDPIRVIIGFFQSIFILIKFKPNVIMVAGGFVGVPVAWASWLLRIPVLIHQQDIIPGLANKLMANIATKITVSFEISLKDFHPKKTILTGNPTRADFTFCDKVKSRQFFGIKDELPVILICGGGTGSQKINEIVEQSLAELLQFSQVIHLTGKDKKINVEADNYHQFEFLTHEMPEALCAADLVINRAGISTLSELIITSKPTVLIPIAETHQEFNAQYFQKNNAVMVLSEPSLNNEIFTATVSELLANDAERENLSRNIAKMMPRDGAAKVASILTEIAK